jgi:hypothetical protein
MKNYIGCVDKNNILQSWFDNGLIVMMQENVKNSLSDKKTYLCCLVYLTPTVAMFLSDNARAAAAVCGVYVVTMDVLMSSPLGDYFSIIVVWNTEEVVTVCTI